MMSNPVVKTNKHLFVAHHGSINLMWRLLLTTQASSLFQFHAANVDHRKYLL